MCSHKWLCVSLAVVVMLAASSVLPGVPAALTMDAPDDIRNWHIVGQLSNFDAQGIAVAGSFAYVAAGEGGVRVVDIRDPANPAEVGWCDTPGSAVSVVVDGHQAYVADTEGGLRVISVADPVHPVEIGFLDPVDFLQANDVAVTGNYVLVAGGGHYSGNERNGLLVVDVADPTRPAETRFYSTRDAGAAVAISGDYAYLVGEAIFLVVDLNGPAGATVLDNPSLYPTDVVASGQYLYVTAMASSGGGLYVYGIDDASHPVLIGDYVIDCPMSYCGLSTVAISGKSAYAGTSAYAGSQYLSQISLDDPTWPQQIAYWSVPGRVEGLAVTDENIFIAGGEGGLVVMGEAPSHSTYLPIISNRYRYAAPLNMIGQVGGSANAVALASTTAESGVAYLGTGLNLVTVNVSDPAAPRVMGRSGPLPEMIEDIFVANDMAYVAAGRGGLWLIDVNDPSHPRVVSSFDNPAYSIDSAGYYLYLATGNGLRIVDVSDHHHPLALGFYQTTGRAVDVAVAGNYVYLAILAPNSGLETPIDSGLLVVDISDPAYPAQAGLLRAPSGYSQVKLSGQQAYVTERWSSWHTCGSRLSSIDVSTPTRPRPVGEVVIHAALNCADYPSVEISGNYAYLVFEASFELEGGLFIIDVLNPANMFQVAHYPTTGYALDIAVLGRYAYIAHYDTGLRVIDVADPAKPREVGFYDPPGTVLGVGVDGNLACVIEAISEPYQRALWTIDVEDRSNPREVGLFAIPANIWDLEISGGYAYLASDPSALRIVSLADPAHPAEVGRYDSPGQAWGVTVVGQYAYLAALDSGLRIVNVSDPTHPQEVGFYDTPGYAGHVALAGRYAYVADGAHGLRVIDVANPAHPREVGSYPAATEARGVAVSGDYAFLALSCSSIDYGRCGLSILNITDRAHPVEVGFLATPAPLENLAVSGNRVYVSENPYLAPGGGLWVINIANPARPALIDYYWTPGQVGDVAVAANHVFVAAGTAGLQILSKH